ncbi:MAG: thioesterase [Gammaproteobacteria bacterium]|nr:MAG: thioesterase [Gammaproteobacteria bacterium]
MTNLTARAHALLDRTLDDIPVTRAMQIRLQDYDDESLTLAAPLAPNVNDKGCAFGGSLASLATLAGWGLVALWVQAAGYDCEIYVQDSSISYLAPIWGELAARAELAEGESREAFLAALATRRRARLALVCRMPDESGADACVLEARFVAIVKKSAPAA